jgi:PAS domain S-box-containing protein
MKEKALFKVIDRKRDSINMLLNSVPVPVFYKEIDGSFVEFNKAFEKLLGMSREELIGKTVFDICPKEYAEKYSSQDKKLLANPGIQVYKHGIKLKNGLEYEVQFNKSTFSNDKKEVIGIMGVINVCKA